MKKRHLVLLLTLLLLPGAAMAAPPLTERDWIVNLTEIMGLSFGLPDQPTDADYQRILDGRRQFRLEAEELFQPGDMVAASDFRSFGEYSGRGWLSGIATPTTARLRFLLPRAGTYELTAAVRLSGHRLRLGDREFTVDGGYEFARRSLGAVVLTAGEQEVVISVPPNGGIDYLELSAPHLPPVRPAGGWHPERPLTLEVMAETVAQALGLASLLPPGGRLLTIEAETVPVPSGAKIVDDRYLGEPSGGRWLRAGAAPADIRIVFDLSAAGVHDLDLRAASSAPLQLTINEGLVVETAFPEYLQTRPVGTFTLPAGRNVLELRLPPRSGIDLCTLRGRESAGSDWRRLAGLADGANPPSAAQVERLLTLLAALGDPR